MFYKNPDLGVMESESSKLVFDCFVKAPKKWENPQDTPILKKTIGKGRKIMTVHPDSVQISPVLNLGFENTSDLHLVLFCPIMDFVF